MSRTHTTDGPERPTGLPQMAEPETLHGQMSTAFP